MRYNSGLVNYDIDIYPDGTPCIYVNGIDLSDRLSEQELDNLLEQLNILSDIYQSVRESND